MNTALFLAQARALVEGERDALANAANLSALLFNSWEQVNWAGFYFRSGQELVLGPFQGQVACTRIPWGQGVCGTAAQQRRSLIVPDVHAFAGHIACDAASASELVVPLIRQGRVLGVLDIDSPHPRRFRSSDLECAQKLVNVYMNSLNSVSCAAFG
ncbi:MAG: GAF domain-containing protein [Oceanococcus sp.]